MATPIFWLSVHIKLVREEDTRCVSKNICISVLLRMQGHNLRRLKWTLWLLFSIDEGEARWTWNLRLIARVRAGNFTVQSLLHPGVQTENGELLENLLATCMNLPSIHWEILYYSYLLYTTESGIICRQEWAAKLERFFTHLPNAATTLSWILFF